MKIAFFSTKPYDRQYFDLMNAGQHEFLYLEIPLNTATAQAASGCEGICIFVNDRVEAATAQKLAALGVKVVALRCAGFNHVDIKACTEAGLKVYRVPAYSPHAVAEHALALILSLNRKTHKAYNRVRESNFSIDRLTGFDLYGKTVGVIGTGEIGAAFSRIMLGMGCTVLAYDLKPKDALAQAGVSYVGLEQLFQRADILSLHCPLTAATKHLIGAEQMDMMKEGAMLINTSRGALIDTKAAIQALKKGKLGYLGIDVYEEEENVFFHDLSESIIEDDVLARLMTFPNVLITAHQAFLTAEALAQIAQTTLDNLACFSAKQTTPNEIFLT